MTCFLEKDGKQQIQQGKKGANSDNNHHVTRGYDGGTDDSLATGDVGTLQGRMIPPEQSLAIVETALLPMLSSSSSSSKASSLTTTQHPPFG